jgi:hypothetical protein
MTATLLLAGVLFAQAAPFTIEPYTGAVDSTDVAYEAMSQGRTDQAIAQLRGQTDPAALINLGTAYARKGMRGEALASFTAAMAADRYELQLADGSWIDSRRAARIAAARLDRASALAVR